MCFKDIWFSYQNAERNFGKVKSLVKNSLANFMCKNYPEVKYTTVIVVQDSTIIFTFSYNLNNNGSVLYEEVRLGTDPCTNSIILHWDVLKNFEG